MLPVAALQDLPPVLGPCHLVGYLEVDVDGSMSVCPTSGEFPADSPLRLGNVTHEEVSVLVDRYRRTPLYWLIATHGPVAVGQLAELAGVSSPDAHHDCVLCEALHRDRSLVATISEELGLTLHRPVSPSEFAEVVDRLDVILGTAMERPVEVRV